MEETFAIKTRSLALRLNPASVAGALLLLQVASLWPVWLWYVQRIHDRSDEPYGLLALATVALYVLTEHVRDVRLPGTRTLLISGAFMIAYIVSERHCPMLLQACLAMLAAASLFSSTFLRKPFHLPTWGLILLSLPVVASLQFYAGFPLRVLCTDAAAVLLRFSGYMVAQQGTGLIWNGHFVGIDAACSGVKLIWAALYTCFTLAALNGLNNKRTFVLSIVALFSALVGNVFRATSLFFVEVLPKNNLPIAMPAWTHDCIGVMVFVLIAATIAGVCKLLHRNGGEKPPVKLPSSINSQSPVNAQTPFDSRSSVNSRSSVSPPSTGESPALVNSPWLGKATLNAPLALTGFLLLCLMAAVAPTVPNANLENIHASELKAAAPPTTFEGAEVKLIPLTPTEQNFLSAFPGRIAKLTDGRNQIIFRTVNTPTRQLHPAEDCFKGLGYSIHPIASIRDYKGQTWGRFEAVDGPTHLVVREMISDNQGNSWTDVSSWYWAAFLGKTHAPWVAITVATQVEALR